MQSKRFRSLIFWSLVLIVWADSSHGQSGRRTPQPAATPKPQIKENPQSDSTLRQRVKVLVARQPTSRRLLSEDTIYSAFVQRLNEQKNLQATAIGDLKKRSAAVKRAQTETDQFLVLLQLEIDNFQEGTIVLNSPDLEIVYTVFEPVTGKERFKGKVYFQAIGGARARKDAWPNGPPIKITPEAAAIAAADGLYDWLLLKTGIRER
jgi:hypothetical protein